MTDITVANKMVADAASIPEGVKRSELVFKEIICSEGLFCAGTLTNGKYAAAWANSVIVADTKESLLADYLNKHEGMLFSNGIKK